MSTSISIVTAFFDIGRGDWSEEKGHPNYLHRPTEKYFNFFENLAKLNNDFVVFTTMDLVDKILEIRGNRKTKIITLDLDQEFSVYLNKIANIQMSTEFKNKIDQTQLKNPEYWSAKYVLVNNLKAYFVNRALQEAQIKNDGSA